MINRKLISSLALMSVAAFSAVPAITQAEVEVAVKSDGERVAAKQITGVITSIDSEARTVNVEGPMGNVITLSGPEGGIQRLEEFAVGDFVTATFAASLSSELRPPTAEEAAQPWVELDGSALADSSMAPGAVVGRVVRAVCTIEGMNRVSRTVVIKDPRGQFHVIGDVEPAKMDGVALGDPVIVTYSEAIALTLEKHQSAK